MPKKVKLILKVEAATLFDISAPTESQILEHCALVDENTGNTASKSQLKNEAFEVYEEEDVRWEGKAVESIETIGPEESENWDYDVGIVAIIYFSNTSNENFFPENILIGKGTRKAHVTSKVKKFEGYAGNREYDYMIIFSIYAQGNEHKTYFIDPKLNAKIVR